MTQQQWLFTVSLALGAALIIAQIIVSFLAYRKAKEPLKEPEPPTGAGVDAAAANETAKQQAISQEKAVDLLKTLASTAPLLVGGIILIGLSALVSGNLAFEASTTVGDTETVEEGAGG
jgi:hypothetical protein